MNYPMFKKFSCIYFALIFQLQSEISTTSLLYLGCLLKQYLREHLLLQSRQKADDEKAERPNLI